MTLTTIALTLGILVSLAVACVFAALIVGAASDPLSQFDSPYERQDKRSVREDRDRQGKNSIHFGGDV